MASSSSGRVDGGCECVWPSADVARVIARVCVDGCAGEQWRQRVGKPQSRRMDGRTRSVLFGFVWFLFFFFFRAISVSVSADVGRALLLAHTHTHTPTNNMSTAAAAAAVAVTAVAAVAAAAAVTSSVRASKRKRGESADGDGDAESTTKKKVTVQPTMERFSRRSVRGCAGKRGDWRCEWRRIACPQDRLLLCSAGPQCLLRPHGVRRGVARAGGGRRVQCTEAASRRLTVAALTACRLCRVAESAEAAAAKEAKFNPYQLEWKEHGSLLYLVSQHNRIAFQCTLERKARPSAHNHALICPLSHFFGMLMTHTHAGVETRRTCASGEQRQSCWLRHGRHVVAHFVRSQISSGTQRLAVAAAGHHPASACTAFRWMEGGDFHQPKWHFVSCFGCQLADVFDCPSRWT